MRAANPLAAIARFMGGPPGAAAAAVHDVVEPLIGPGLQAQYRQTVKEVMASRLVELRAAWQAERNRVDEHTARFASNYLVRLEKLSALPVDAKLVGLVQAFDLENQIEEEAALDVERVAKERKAKELAAQAQLALEAKKTARLTRIQQAHSAVQVEAKKSPPIFDVTNTKLICNMVCTVVDLETGYSETGRAGHGISRATFEGLLKTTISASPANVHVAQNTVNCAEWAALRALLTKHPPKAYSDLYFVAAVPGHQGSLIPPCANCERLMNFLFANAYGYAPKAKTSTVG
jgi:hypothetical protein